MSEKYYKSIGVSFLSFRNRFAILLALIIYRQIGIKIIRKNFSNIYKREKVNFFEKLFCILKCLIIFSFKIEIHKKNFKHDKSLHKYIKTFLLIKNENVILKSRLYYSGWLLFLFKLSYRGIKKANK